MRKFTSGALLALVVMSYKATPAAPYGLEKSFPSNTIRLTVKVQNQKYCSHGLGLVDLPMLRFELVLRFENISDSAIVLNGIRVGDSIFVGKSIRDLRAQKYEPGSKMPESMEPQPTAKSLIDVTTVLPRKAVEIRTANSWVLVALDKSQRRLGVSPGKHFLQVFAGVDLSNDSHGPATLIRSSLPAQFVVERNPKIENCD
jgi:hypothetical protein